MIVCFDTHYTNQSARTACVSFKSWADETPVYEWVFDREGTSSGYQPGQFYLRELPHIMNAIERISIDTGILLIDGHVWLDAEQTQMGLGAHLYESISHRSPVIGVAKRQYRNNCSGMLYRGKSKQPLYVSAAGISRDEAKQAIIQMYGDYRIPTLIKRADYLSRHKDSKEFHQWMKC